MTFPSEPDDPVSPVSVMSGKLADRATPSSSRNPRRPTRRSGSTPTSTAAAVSDSLAEATYTLALGAIEEHERRLDELG